MKHTISILCDNKAGVMTRISGLFSRRGFNIESLTVGTTEKDGKSRFTIVVQGDDSVLEQIRKQLQKLVHVIKVWDIKNESIIEREHSLIKIEVDPERRSEILQIITAAEARILDSTGNYWTLEVTGSTAAVSSAISLLSEYNIVESIRTGRIALERGSVKSK